MDNSLRFGDVLKGYITATPNIKAPIFAINDSHYNVDIQLPIFSVVLSPCCSIGNKTISLAPLIELRGAFFRNPYFVDDLTNINRMMEPQQAVPPEVWASFPEMEKQKRLEEGKAYAILDNFIYEKHDMFPTYTVRRKDGDIITNYYMVDFRNIHKLNCDSIKTQADVPLESKCLQLSIQTRSELREKIAYYYGRMPKEDLVLED